MATLPGYAQLTFPEAPEDRPYVVVNMVMSGDGKIVIEGTEQGLGSKADQALMGQLRSHADAVLNGGETLRKSGSTPLPRSAEMRALREQRGLSKAPLGVILSRGGDLPLDAEFFTSPEFEGVVFLADSAPEKRRRALEGTRRRVVPVPAGDAVRAMLASLRREFNVRLLLCEGGAQLNGSLFDAGAVDEYFVTVGARIVGGNVVLTPVRGDRRPSFETVRPLTLLSAVTNSETSEVYLRYRVGTTEGRATS